MSPEEKQVAKTMLETMIFKSQVAGAVAATMARASTPAVREKVVKRAAAKCTGKRRSA